jgi:hypothetical protein
MTRMPMHCAICSIGFCAFKIGVGGVSRAARDMSACAIVFYNIFAG